ncbi:MAG: hypothetical protein IJZ12_04280 [Clostridia bacterium]|nr:hypothetical protein [Clostridia bacterium]
MSVNEKMTAIADNIRDKTGGTEILTLDEMANGINEVYEAGKRKEWSDFWDAYQNYGQRDNYRYGFYFFYSSTDPEHFWTDENFKPKYDIKPNNIAEHMFDACGFTDLKGILEKQGVVLDTSSATNLQYAFANCTYLTRVPVIDVSKSKNANVIQYLFQFCNSLEYVEKLIIPSTVDTSFFSVFNGCYKLKEVRIEGVIATSISFTGTKYLSVESMKSVISCLKNYAGTTKEHTYTVTFKAVVFEALEALGETPPSGNTWAEHIDNLKWNLTLS